MKQGWEIKKLGDFCKVIAGQSPKGSSYNANGVGVEFHQGKKAFGADVIEHSNVWTTEATRLAEAGDILISVRAPVGPTNFTDREVCIGRGLAAIRCTPMVLPQFILYALKNIEDKIVGKDGAVFNSINKDMIEDLPVPMLGIAEQERIVEILDREFERIDVLKANAEQNLQHAKDLFQAALKQELQPKEGWVTMKLGAFAHMKAGDFIKASDIKDEYFEGAYPCYGGNGLRGYVKEPNRNGEYCLIGRQGALCGNIHIANGVFRATEHAVVVSPYQKMPIKLIYYLLVSLNLNQYSTGAAQPGLSVKNIADNVSISVPPKDIWNSIALRLEVIESNCKALEEHYRKTIVLCDDMKQALLRKAFNGEL